MVLPPSDHYCIETVAPSGDHYCIDIVVPSSDHCCTVAAPPSSDYYGTTKVAPPSDHLHTKRTYQRKLIGEKNIHQKFGGHGPCGPLWLRHWPGWTTLLNSGSNLTAREASIFR